MTTTGSGNIAVIGRSQTIPFRITCTAAVEVVVVFGIKGGDVLEKWAYPEREEYQLLEADSEGHFDGCTAEECTAAAEEGLLVMDVKAWNIEGQNIIKRGNIAMLASTFVDAIERAEEESSSQ